MSTDDCTNPTITLLGRTLPYDPQTGTFVLKEDTRTTYASASRGQYTVRVSVREGHNLYELSGYGMTWREAEYAFLANYMYNAPASKHTYSQDIYDNYDD